MGALIVLSLRVGLNLNAYFFLFEDDCLVLRLFFGTTISFVIVVVIALSLLLSYLQVIYPSTLDLLLIDA